MTEKIDFSGLADAARGRAELLLEQWLPHGHREGFEWKSVNPTRGDRSEGSFSININTGAWGDFATDEKGGDLVSLFAAVFGLEMGRAAAQVAREEGLEDVAGVSRAAGDTAPRPVRPPAPPAALPEDVLLLREIRDSLKK